MASEFNEEAGERVDPVRQVKEDNYRNALRESEDVEARKYTRLELRQRIAREACELKMAPLREKEEQCAAKILNLQQCLDEAKRERGSAVTAAFQFCAQIGVVYKAGKTTERDITAVPRMPEATAAKKLGLRLGLGTVDKWTIYAKPPLTLFCWGMSSISMGLMCKLLSPQHLFDDSPKVVASLLLGGVVAGGSFLSMTHLWRQVGAKEGSCQPKKDVADAIKRMILLTAILALGLATLDGHAIVLLYAGLSVLDPTAQMPMEWALIIGSVFNALYVLALAASAYSGGYVNEASASIAAEINLDEDAKRNEIIKQEGIQNALRSIAAVEAADDTIKDLQTDIDKAEATLKTERTEVYQSLPEIPTSLDADEEKEIALLNNRVRSAKIIADADISSRGDHKP